MYVRPNHVNVYKLPAMELFLDYSHSMKPINKMHDKSLCTKCPYFITCRKNVPNYRLFFCNIKCDYRCIMHYYHIAHGTQFNSLNLRITSHTRDYIS